jgi:DMSO reductase family type II enzyme chaperone
MRDVITMNPTVHRMRFYQEIASLFGPPTPEISIRLANGAFVDELTELGSLVPCASTFDDVMGRKANFKQPREEISTIYTTTFEVPNPPVSLSESGHVQETTPELYEDLYRVYEYFGLNFEQGTIKNRPDTLTVELDFMQYLVYLESHQQENVTPLRKAQCDFLDRHLSRFVDSLVNKLKEKDVSPYQELGLLLKAFVSAEKSYLVEFKDPKCTGDIIPTLIVDNTPAFDSSDSHFIPTSNR